MGFAEELLGGRLNWFGVLLGIRRRIRIGDGSDIGSSLAEVGVEEGKSDESTENNRNYRNGQDGIHFR